MFGAMAPAPAAWMSTCMGEYWALSEAIVDCYAARPPDLHLMDAVTGHGGHGAHAGQAARLGLVAASTDGVALDAVMQRCSGFTRRRSPRPSRRTMSGLGESTSIAHRDHRRRPGAVRDPVERAPVVRAEQLGLLLPLLRLLVTARPKVRKDCRGCGACAGICPAGAVAIEDYARSSTATSAWSASAAWKPARSTPSREAIPLSTWRSGVSAC